MQHSSIAWKQIGVGYLVCGCVFLGAVAGIALPPRPSHASENSLLGFAVLVVAWALWWLTRWLWRQVAPDGLPASWQEPAKTTAVLALLLGSLAGTALLGARFWQMTHG
ncbi:hypothetical protein [Roseomonas sp. 18066]|uniref:hypothetical protein n=1 Tax=Roseomonas sp. 18066 TaxID=2681412 RepID=UPI00135B41DE|nr:hypothetical protein [Roseomonas sp. 18066]